MPRFAYALTNVVGAYHGGPIVERQLRAGSPIYGTTTGIGLQKDVAVPSDRLADFSDRMIISEATDFPGDLFPERVVRAALLVLINNVARGRSGVPPIVVERLLELLRLRDLPPVRRDTSYRVAALTPLSQLSLARLGRSTESSESARRPALKLAPKESVSLIDNNSFALGHGALVLVEVRHLLRAFDLAGAVALEGLRGGVAPHMASASGGRSGVGQARLREYLLAALEGSTLHLSGRARSLQDPLSFRSITQIHGAAREAWQWAKQQFGAEINVSTLTPLSVSQTESLLLRCWEIVSLEIAIGVWAIARRNLPILELGVGVRKVFETIRPFLPIGEEGTSIFDFSPIVSVVRSHCLSRALHDSEGL